MNEMMKFWLLSLICLMAASCAADDLGMVYNEISEDESDLQFYGPGLAGGPRQIIAGERSDGVRRATATYGSVHGYNPRARLYFIELPPRSSLRRPGTLKSQVEDWGWFKGQTVRSWNPGKVETSLGEANFVTFAVDESSCVAWQIPLGFRNGSLRWNKLVEGYYCGTSEKMMSEQEAASIVKLVGHRKYGPVEPPAEWMPTLPQLTAEILNFGPYEMPKEDEKESETQAEEESDPNDDIEFGAATTRIQPVIDGHFGFQYVLRGLPDGEILPITMRSFHPEFNGRTSHEYTGGREIGKPYVYGFHFDHEFERVPGVWKFEIRYGDRMLAEKSFEVLPPG